MNSRSNPIQRRWPVLALLASLVAFGPAPSAFAFPPAPYHLIYGVVRDQYGSPLTSTKTQIILETPTGVQITAGLVPGLAAGVNFEIKVPMDAGLTPDLYQPTALTASAPFKLYVVVGSVTNIPIEMTGNYAQLGLPGQSTRMDLTLGVDSNGDGIPDAWEYAFLAAIGSNLSLSSLNPNSVLAHDGRTLQQEFVVGTYPFDPADPFVVNLVSYNDGSPILSFPAITGRSYTVLGSSDMTHWFPLSFHLAGDSANAATHSFYYASSVQTVQVQVVQSGSISRNLYLKVLVQ